ncbi:Hypothetical protein I596_3257 [Dokdonella koreensis DS-123]|uniref:Uncharacterized protein n=1 Tax=Dokdonella koreensis DS-123 TaxID=1300342 RepID=A0A167H714_9GAMM|nr:Hypothetical protein I596_3257 [Dokdonella koreensis DS-123]
MPCRGAGQGRRDRPHLVEGPRAQVRAQAPLVRRHRHGSSPPAITGVDRGPPDPAARRGGLERRFAETARIGNPAAAVAGRCQD